MPNYNNQLDHYFSASLITWLENILISRFNIDLSLRKHTSYDKHELHMTLPGSKATIRFSNLEKDFHTPGSALLCKNWNIEGYGIAPLISTMLPGPSTRLNDRPLFTQYENEIVIHYDILGMVFWVLSRLEEVEPTQLDSHGRFPSHLSHASKYGYLHRPIVDEWLHILAHIMKLTWPTIEIRKACFQVVPSHDVDVAARYSLVGIGGLIRRMMGDLLILRRLDWFTIAPLLWLTSNRSIHRSDPANTYSWLMDVAEANNTKTTFFFLCGKTDPNKDATYSLNDPAIQSLIRLIHQRGHSIGLHSSYRTSTNATAMKQEVQNLQDLFARGNISQAHLGNRMHYLKWKHPETLNNIESCGLDYDSSLGYPDVPGFRCGTCHEYQAFDPINLKPINVTIQPLIAMECSVFKESTTSKHELSLAVDSLMQLKDTCIRAQGNFTLLWHNTTFWRPEHFEAYKTLLS